MRYRICWRDGTTTENLTYEESMRLIKLKPADWSGVQPMDYGRDCHADNAKAKQKAWGSKTK